MFFLFIKPEQSIVGIDKLRQNLSIIPNLEFDYDIIMYDSTKTDCFKIYNNETIILTEDEIQKIQNFCNNYPYKIWLLNDDGICIGEGTYGNHYGNYAHCPPINIPGSHFWYNPDTKNWDYIYGVDTNKKYIGNVPFKECSYIANMPCHFGDFWVWDNDEKKWVDSRSLDELKQIMIEKIKENYSASISSGLLYDSTIWGISDKDIKHISDADINILKWNDIDGDIVELNNISIIELKLIIENYKKHIDDHYNVLIDKIKNVLNIEELDAINEEVLW